VSFAAKHLQELRREDYYVCEKTDGMRFLMYLTEDGPDGSQVVYLIDRKNNYYWIPHLHFPHHEDKTFQRFHTNTILDGELVEDKLPGRDPVMKFLVFDCLSLDGNILMHRPLDKRLGYFKVHVLEPYKAMHKQQPERPRPFVVEDKSTEFSYGLEKMFRDIIPRVKQLHGNDGLIFTCKNTPYKHGTDEHILKWKPPAENTVDFLMHITWPALEPELDDPDQTYQPDYLSFPPKFELFVHTNTHHGVGDYEYFDDLYVTPSEWEEMKSKGIPLQDVVVECYQEALPQPNGYANGNDVSRGDTRWRFHRFREDKMDANHVSVVESVIQSIQDRVTEDDLLRAADSIRSAWKQREAENRERMRKEEAMKRGGR
jgi:mRNA guanylyltransferase